MLRRLSQKVSQVFNIDRDEKHDVQPYVDDERSRETYYPRRAHTFSTVYEDAIVEDIETANHGGRSPFQYSSKIHPLPIRTSPAMPGSWDVHTALPNEMPQNGFHSQIRRRPVSATSNSAPDLGLASSIYAPRSRLSRAVPGKNGNRSHGLSTLIDAPVREPPSVTSNFSFRPGNELATSRYAPGRQAGPYAPKNPVEQTSGLATSIYAPVSKPRRPTLNDLADNCASSPPAPTLEGDQALAQELYKEELMTLLNTQPVPRGSTSSRNHDYEASEFVLNAIDESLWQPYDEQAWDTAQGKTPGSSHPKHIESREMLSHVQPEFRADNFYAEQGNENVQRKSTFPKSNTSRGSPFLSTDRQKGSDKATEGMIDAFVDWALNIRECVICAEEKPPGDFPLQRPTRDCQHEATTCLTCLQTYIKTQMENKVFNEGSIKCPECSKSLEVSDVQRYSDPVTFQKFSSLATESTIDQIPGLFRCPLPTCGAAHIHESGTNSPIIRCIGCKQQFCFHHKVPWHETLSCEEYDEFLADPDNFQSRLELQNEQNEKSQREVERIRREQEEADQRFAQSLMAQDEREEAQRQAERDRKARLERDRREQARREAERQKAEAARQQIRREAEKKAKEEQANLRTIARTTKKCPKCTWPIEKNDGCAHMTCKLFRCSFLVSRLAVFELAFIWYVSFSK
ncbi:hypothetical protein BT63DRAFT_427519 [Microthyrium microscopicum]|uniref:RBR-type E3 ubiquitin transferase n=1 Tax=Microthyrium microscopicum TaxID=703497 RepID=A0A6A6U4N6_9PEZI|nr:hypothetical protein BT63DRAFT_427519 [Microthyrium microscopicum]